MNVLFLFESILPKEYGQETTSPGELRVIASQEKVDRVVALGRAGKSFYQTDDGQNKTEIEKKIEIVRFDWSKTPLGYYFVWWRLLWQGYGLCKQYNIELIHAESPHISGIAAVILGKLLKVKVIVEYRVSYENLIRFRFSGVIQRLILWYFTTICRFVFSQANVVAANSQTYAAELKKKYGLKNVFHYGPGFRKPVTAKRTGKAVGYMARLYPEKGPMDFLKMIYLGRIWFRRNKTKFLLAGEGPEQDACLAFIQKNHLDDLVKMVGTVDRWKFLRKLQLFINTTQIASALEMTNAEAAAMGIPVLAYGRKGYPETVIDAKTGVLITPGNVALLLNEVKKLLKDKQAIVSMVGNSILHSSAYEFKTQSQLLNEIYLNIKRVR